MFIPRVARLLGLSHDAELARQDPVIEELMPEHFPDPPPAPLPWRQLLTEAHWWTLHPVLVAEGLPVLLSIATRLQPSSPSLSEQSDYLKALTACVGIERLLGDLVFSSSSSSSSCSSSSSSSPTVPQNLTDLLAHPLVLDVLGCKLVFWLSLLLGAPSGLNLRNYLWHGFFVPASSLPAAHGLLLRSTLQMLSRSFPPSAARPFEPLPPLTASLGFWGPPPLLPSPTEFDALISDSFSSSSPVLQAAASLLSTSFSLFTLHRDCHHALVLLLPVFEFVVRFKYCLALSREKSESQQSVDVSRSADGEAAQMVDVDNNDQDGLLADNTKYFLIFEHFVDTPSPLQRELSPSGFSGICDFFVYPDGPRIRDRVSHGTCDPALVPESLLASLFELLLHVASPSTTPYPHPSRFHPRALLQQALSPLSLAFNSLVRDVAVDWPAAPSRNPEAYAEYWRHLRSWPHRHDGLLLEWTPDPLLATLHLPKDYLSKLSLLRETAAVLADMVTTIHSFASDLQASLATDAATSRQSTVFDKLMQHSFLLLTVLHGFYILVARSCRHLDGLSVKSARALLTRAQKCRNAARGNAWTDVVRHASVVN